MPSFGTHSKTQLATCDERLQKLADEVIKYFNFTVVEGHRDEAAQTKAFLSGNSQTPWPKSKHNSFPSKAFDVAPYPIDWSNREAARQRFVFLAGIFWLISKQLGIPIRWGGDWNRNLDTRDENFRDLPHFEISEVG